MDLSIGSRRKTHTFALLAALALTPACGAEGPQGPAGADGKAGVDGSKGADGSKGSNGSNGSNGNNGADGKDATVDPSLSPLEKAYLAMGGKDALKAITSLTESAQGATWIVGEGHTPEDVLKVSSFKADLEHDLGKGGLRVSYDRTVDFFGFPQPLAYQEIIKGNLGATAGTVSILGAPAGDMRSDRWASIHKTHRLLNPQLILKDVAEGTLTAKDGGPGVLDGVLHQIVLVDDEVAPIELWVSAQTGKLTKLSTMENDHVLRDIPLEAFYEGWTASAAGLRYPSAVYIARNDVIIRQEERGAFAVNVAIPETEFDLPAGSMAKYDEAEAKHGRANSQFNQMFSGVGIPLDGLQTFVQPVQISPRVWQLRGGSHNTMVVEQSSGLVLADAPLYNDRSEAILAWAKTQFPNKPVKWVTITHHHDDHVGGVRAFAAAGASIVVGEAAKDFILESLGARSTVVPDKLALMGGKIDVIGVPKGGTFTMPDALEPVISYEFDSVHADGMMMIHVPQAQILWATDIYSANVPVPPPAMNFLAQQLHAAIVQKGLAVQTLITGHGNGSNTFAEFTAAIGL